MNTQGRGKGSLVQAEDEQADTERRDHAASPGSGHQSGAGRTQGGSASGRGTAAQDSGVEQYCTRLPVSWNREELRQLFEPFGHVTSVQVPQQTVHPKMPPSSSSSGAAAAYHHLRPPSEDTMWKTNCECWDAVSKETYSSVKRDYTPA